jgi:hypothetical protein
VRGKTHCPCLGKTEKPQDSKICVVYGGDQFNDYLINCRKKINTFNKRHLVQYARQYETYVL